MSNVLEKNLTDFIDQEWHGFRWYTSHIRAILSYIDGLKPSARKLVYAMIHQFKGKKTKVAELGSSLPSYNYHHSESSAMGAVVTLGGDWNNNIPIFRGYGNFGSRLIQEASAPRYIYCDLNPEFNKYFVHSEVCNKNIDIDNPEPQQYLPLIPWVLVNGIEGIAVGFKCEYLPHDPKDIVKACIKAANGKLKKYDLKVKFPNFKGEIIYNADNPRSVVTRGIVEKSGRNGWLITELPYGYDREKYYNVLKKLSDDKVIIDFEDRCDETGFNFFVKQDTANFNKTMKDPIGEFKLDNEIKEHYTALDEYGKLIIFNDKVEIINRFVEFRIKKVREFIDYEIVKHEIDLNWLLLKREFIGDVLNNKIEVAKQTKDNLIKSICDHFEVDEQSANRLIQTPVYNMTQDQVDELSLKISSIQTKLDGLNNTNERELYISLLKDL